MTICVATISGGMIFGASDRMLTSADIQFEPEKSKIFPLTNSIVVMLAGDSGWQADILHDLSSEVTHHLNAKPNEWLNVEYIARQYIKYHGAMRARLAEVTYLAPLGLDQKSFQARQKELAPELVTQLATEMLHLQAPEIQALIVGIDVTGPHIYLCDNDGISCQDHVGFAAIGAGFWHANSQFMLAGHSPAKSLGDTIWLTYLAKRRAEVAPGVGEATDMFTIGPALGSSVSVDEIVLSTLRSIYNKARKSEERTNKKAQEQVNAYVEELTEKATEGKQAASSGDASKASSNSTNDRSALAESDPTEKPDTEASG